MTVLIGAIADDFTGATDLANTLVKEGMRVVQVIGVPQDPIELNGAQAVVVALKSRTAPVAEAVAQSVEALRWLRKIGAVQFISKYCSTFDSTSQGNIGPVAEALADELSAGTVLVCPAFPQNKRTIYQGNLFVGSQLLSESSMKDHPLTPMRESNLVTLMQAQTTSSVGLVDWHTIRDGDQSIQSRLVELKAEGCRFVVADSLVDADLRMLGKAAEGHTLVTGGSGIAIGLPENFRKRGLLKSGIEPDTPKCGGRSLVLAGSCSEATRKQIEQARQNWPTMRLDVDEIARAGDVANQAVNWALGQNESKPVLIYASADPEEISRIQARYGKEEAGLLVEDTMGHIASRLTENGFDRLVVAGGETSGAVVSALGIRALEIGQEIAPGVPWTQTLSEPRLAIALKSGNFGGPNFFEEAFARLG